MLDTITVTSRRAGRAAVAPRGDERARIWREDLVQALLGATMVVGLFLDGWNHINLQHGELGGFLTPWHGALYAGFTLAALWVATRNLHLAGRGAAAPYLHRVAGVPLRYPFAVVGICVSTLGLVGDIAWHTVFGVEGGVARVIGPFHIALFFGAGLLLAAPLRSAWHAPWAYPRRLPLVDFLPALLSLAEVTALVAFLFQWLSAFTAWPGATPPTGLALGAEGGGSLLAPWEITSVARVLVTNIVLVGAVLVAQRRWAIPFGGVALLFGGVALAMSALTDFALLGAVGAAVAGGLGGDLLLLRLGASPDRPGAHRALGGLLAVFVWSAYFALASITGGMGWPADLALGTVCLAAASGVVLSWLTLGPGTPA